MFLNEDFREKLSHRLSKKEFLLKEDVFKLNDQGNLTHISQHDLYMKKGPARGMVADNIDGTDYLFIANKHGNVIETFKINENGYLFDCKKHFVSFHVPLMDFVNLLLVK